MTRRLFPELAVVLLCLTCLTGCWEYFSWSPDGRYLAFVGVDDDGGPPWQWDTRTGQATRLPARSENVIQVKYLSSVDEYLLVYGDDRFENAAIEIRGVPNAGDRWDLGVNTAITGFAISPDTARLYVAHARQTEDGDIFELKEFDIARRAETRVLFSTELEIAWPAVSPSGDRLLFNLEEDSIQMLPLDDAYFQPRAVVREGERDVTMPVWVDSERFVYLRAGEEDDEGLGELVLHSLKEGRERILHKFAFFYGHPSISPDRSRVLITAPTGIPDEDFDADSPYNFQLVEVEIASGATKVLTDEPLGAVYGAYNPVSNSVAYYSFAGDGIATTRILNLDTRETQIVWTNEEERLVAVAENQMKDDRDAMALATYRDLLARFPESGFTDLAYYGIARLHLKPPLFDLDEAHAAIQKISEGDMRGNIQPLFWRAEDVVASDPAGDLMLSYSPEEKAALAFNFEPNPGMDLVELSARWSDARLFLKIDFASRDDMRLMMSKDLLLVFSREEAWQDPLPFTSQLSWDHPVERMVLLRHWVPGRQYDAEIRDAEGGIVSSLLAVGRFKIAYPGLEFIHRNGRSLVISLSRSADALNLDDDRPVYVQVCTLKSSESHVRPGGVADAFGADNLPDSSPSNVVRGYAALLDPNSLGEQ